MLPFIKWKHDQIILNQHCIRIFDPKKKPLYKNASKESDIVVSLIGNGMGQDN